MSHILFPIILSYLLGAIPTALMAGYLLARMDIRTMGSGNAGATNLYRILGLKPYLAVLALDIGKGYLAAALVSGIVTGPLDRLQMSIVCGLAAVLGHIFTVFARFRGGKGVATATGMMLAIVPAPVLTAVGVYLAVVALTNFVSLGSIAAAVSVPFSLAVGQLVFGAEARAEVWCISVILAVLILATHRSNIKRLMNGEESKTYFFKGKGK